MLNVLVVDDEKLVRQMVMRCIDWEAIGLHIIGEASSARMGLELIDELHPDLVFMDVRMPSMDGLTCSRLIMKKYPQIKILILSGHDEFEYASEGIRIGVFDYLLKPVNAEELEKHSSYIRDRQLSALVHSRTPEQYLESLAYFGVKIKDGVYQAAIVVKPATSNPLTVMKLMGLLVEAGVTPGAVQCVTGRGSVVGNWISDNPAIAQVNLTGGVEAGKEIARHAAENLTAYKFELGGNDPLIICADCDMDLAVNEAGDKTRNAGQCCSGAKRFIVHESIKDEFVKRLIEERLKTVKEGDLLDINTDYGVLISEKAAIEVEKQVQHTIDQGAKLVYGGVRRGAHYMPTVLDNCTKDMDICKNMEIFGPLFPIFTFKTLDEAIEIAETSDYGLSSGVITNNLQDAMKVAASLRTGMVAVNGSGGFRAQELPFGGGKKMSGNSRECMSSVLEEVTQEKSIIFRYAMKKYNED